MNFKIIFLSLLTTITSLPIFSMEQSDIETGLRGQFVQHAQKTRDRFEDNIKKITTMVADKYVPSAQTTEIAHNALRDFGMDPQDVIIAQIGMPNNALALGGTWFWPQKVLVLGEFSNAYVTRHVAYHEIAHLHHNDPQRKITHFLQAAGLIGSGWFTTLSLNRYLKASISFMPTRVGRAIATIGRLALKCGGLYGSCRAGQYYNAYLPSQKIEMCADTAAYQKLMARNDLETCIHTILWYVEKFETPSPIKKVAHFSDSHPTEYERAANGVKILRAHGIDFNNLQGIEPELAKIATEKVNRYFPESK